MQSRRRRKGLHVSAVNLLFFFFNEKLVDRQRNCNLKIIYWTDKYTSWYVPCFLFGGSTLFDHLCHTVRIALVAIISKKKEACKKKEKILIILLDQSLYVIENAYLLADDARKKQAKYVYNYVHVKERYSLCTV